nr:MAG TPA: hypothetical protein [Caudoviricetes sp.]
MAEIQMMCTRFGDFGYTLNELCTRNQGNGYI